MNKKSTKTITIRNVPEPVYDTWLDILKANSYTNQKKHIAADCFETLLQSAWLLKCVVMNNDVSEEKLREYFSSYTNE